MTIERLPGTKLTPKVLLAQVLENSDDYKSVVIISTDEDDTTIACWSRQKLRDVSFAATVLQHQLSAEMDEDVSLEERA